MTSILSSLLGSWALHAHASPTQSTTVPWWLDPDALIDSIVRAAQALGWSARNTFDAEDPDGWDMQILADPHNAMVVRVVGVVVPLGEPSALSDMIADAWRVLGLTAPPPKGVIGCHLVAVEPHLAAARDDTEVEAVVEDWLAANLWRAGSDPKTWARAPKPLPRNASGRVFPGMGLIARIAAA